MPAVFFNLGTGVFYYAKVSDISSAIVAVAFSYSGVFLTNPAVIQQLAYASTRITLVDSRGLAIAGAVADGAYAELDSALGTLSGLALGL